jgi:hypothetical protein
MAAMVAALILAAPLRGAGGQTRIPPAVEAQPFWCPMHADVRGVPGEKCPRCGMALVLAPATDYKPYVVDVSLLPATLRAGQQGHVRFSVREPHSGAPVDRFELVHDRLFHLFIISQDLAYFTHTHPALQEDGSLIAPVALPRAGVYQMVADFVPAGGPPQLIQHRVVTAGYTGAVMSVPPLAPDVTDKVAANTRIKLTMPDAIAGREQLITFELFDAASGAPAENLEPYLGAAGHLLLASADLTIATHSHPVAGISAAHGPTVVFQVLFPTAGTYRLWAQFQRGGEVLTSSFTVLVTTAH